MHDLSGQVETRPCHGPDLRLRLPGFRTLGGTGVRRPRILLALFLLLRRLGAGVGGGGPLLFDTVARLPLLGGRNPLFLRGDLGGAGALLQPLRRLLLDRLGRFRAAAGIPLLGCLSDPLQLGLAPLPGLFRTGPRSRIGFRAGSLVTALAVGRPPSFLNGWGKLRIE